MSTQRKAVHKAHEVKGRAKAAAGRATGNTRRQAEGRAEQVMAKIGHAADVLGEKVGEAVERARHAAER